MYLYHLYCHTSRLGISHVCLIIEASGDLVVYTNKQCGSKVFKNSGRPQTRRVLDCKTGVRDELIQLHREMGVGDGEDMLIALSIASDGMIRHVNMFPEL